MVLSQSVDSRGDWVCCLHVYKYYRLYVLTANASFLGIRCWPSFQPQTTMRLAATGEPMWSWDQTSSPTLFSTKQTRQPICSLWPKGKAFQLLCICQVKIPKGKTLQAFRKFDSGDGLSQLDLLKNSSKGGIKLCTWSYWGKLKG